MREQIRQLGFAGNISKEILDRYSELKAEIDALKIQNQAFLTQKELQDTKAKAEEALRRSIKGILAEIEETLNAKMKEFNDTLFKTHRVPHIKFNKNDSYKFETPYNADTDSNYKRMIVYDLAVLFTMALPALAHDSLVFKNLEKDVEDGIMRIYASTRKQIFIAYDKQGECRPETQRILYDNCVLQLSDNNCELYGRSWNKEEQNNMKMSYNKLWKLLIDKNMKKSDLRKVANVSSSSLAKLSKGENVTTDVILKICAALQCDVGDIMEAVPDEAIESVL